MDTVSAAKPLRRCDASVVRNVMRSLLVSYGEPTGLAIIDCQPLNVVEEYEADVRLGCAVRERRERPVKFIPIKSWAARGAGAPGNRVVYLYSGLRFIDT